MQLPTDHLIIKPEAGHIIKLACAHCGGQQLIQLPMSLTALNRQVEQFRQAHQNCPAPVKRFEG